MAARRGPLHPVRQARHIGIPVPPSAKEHVRSLEFEEDGADNLAENEDWLMGDESHTPHHPPLHRMPQLHQCDSSIIGLFGASSHPSSPPPPPSHVFLRTPSLQHLGTQRLRRGRRRRLTMFGLPARPKCRGRPRVHSRKVARRRPCVRAAVPWTVDGIHSHPNSDPVSSLPYSCLHDDLR